MRAKIGKLESPCGICYTSSSASTADETAGCGVAIDKLKMVITCRHLPEVVSVSLAKSSKHSARRNPQSTDVPVKCTACKQLFWSYHFKQHWEKHHRSTEGNIPADIDTSLAVSQDEIDYFIREARSRSEGWQRSGAAVVVVGVLQRRPRAKVRGNRVNVTARIN